MTVGSQSVGVQAVRAYYHTILPFYEEETAALPDLEFWRSLAAEVSPGWVLELGAGAGRVTGALIERAPVVAMDLSREMLQHAARHLAWRRSQGPKANCAAHLAVADMRQFAFARRFPLIVAPNDPFAHLTRGRDREAALRAIAGHLEPSGRLVIDGLYFPERERIEVSRHRTGGVTVAETWTPVGRGSCWRAQYRYRRNGHRQTASFLARSWTLRGLEATFERAGLYLHECWGGYDRSRFHPEAERMILIAQLVPSRSGASFIVRSS